MNSPAITEAEPLPSMLCKCGKPSVEFDSWFQWFPCEDHKHLTPVEYSRMDEKAQG